MKHYTENKEMYFEAQEVSEGFEVGYQVSSFHKNLNGTSYEFERMLPEDYLLDTEEDAETLASMLPMIYDWGFDDSQYVVRDNIKGKLFDFMNRI
ncbi:hypothetical protein [Aquibacillus saliphilus]|uniref:hypothetical protein n=1 Tax=Aquibacillus saliphilus TaxID=1909422 RepID=UPI001CEFD709|nr:hypothetical protein [Aquibacillus saliphilus]